MVKFSRGEFMAGEMYKRLQAFRASLGFKQVHDLYNKGWQCVCTKAKIPNTVAYYINSQNSLIMSDLS